MLSRFLEDDDTEAHLPIESDAGYGVAHGTHKLNNPDDPEVDDEERKEYEISLRCTYPSNPTVSPQHEDDEFVHNEHDGRLTGGDNNERSDPCQPTTTNDKEEVADPTKIDERREISSVTDRPTRAYDDTTLDHHALVTRPVTTRTHALSSAQPSTDESE
ncbi:hypothetical protein EDB83DRAFT_2469577, partial [Lactarius deliciosus]